MNELITLNQIIGVFEDISNRHKMVHDFDWGPTYNIGASRDMKFPYIWVENVDSSMILSSNGFREKQYTFSVYCMDKINKGDNNFDEIVSDTEFILSTFVQEIYGNPFFVKEGISIVDDVNLLPVVEATDDNVNGWQLDITVKVPFRLTNCDSPITPNTTLNSYFGCSPVTVVDSDGTTVYEIPSGGSFDCQVVQPATVQNSDESYVQQVNPGNTLNLPDIEITTGDGVLTYSSVQDINLSNYYEIINPTGTRIPVNTVTSINTQVLWYNKVNVTSATSSIEKTSGGDGWNADANFNIATLGDFQLEWSVNGVAMVGFSVINLNSSFDSVGFCIYRYDAGYQVYQGGVFLFNMIDFTSNTMKITFIGNLVRYYVNNILIYTSTVLAAPFTHGYFTFDCSLFSVGTQVQNILLTYL